jgi:hypothetical protein
MTPYNKSLQLVKILKYGKYHEGLIGVHILQILFVFTNGTNFVIAGLEEGG